MGALENQFKGGYVINENLGDSVEKPKDPLKDPNGEKLKFDGAGLYNTGNKDVLAELKTDVQEDNEEEKFISPEELSQKVEDLQLSEEEATKKAHKMYNNSNFGPGDIEEGEYIPEQEIDKEVEGGNDVFESENEDQQVSIEEEIAEKDLKQRENMLEENKFFPLIERLYNLEMINVDSYEKVMNNIDQNLGKLNMETLEVDIDEKSVIIENISKLDKNEENLSNFKKDIGDIPEFEEINKAYTDNVDSIEFDLFNEIGKNYIKLNDTNDILEKKFDLEVAINSTANDLLERYSDNLPKDSETYKTALLNIRSGNLEDKVDGIKSLYILGSSIAGFNNAKTEKVRDSINGKVQIELDKREEFLVKKIEIKREELKKNKDDSNKIESEIESLENELKEVRSGEIYKGGKVDKQSESNEKEAQD